MFDFDFLAALEGLEIEELSVFAKGDHKEGLTTAGLAADWKYRKGKP